MTNLSEGLLDQVENSLLHVWGLTPRQVHIRMDVWAPSTVRKALDELMKRGRVVSDGPSGKRTYRRVIAA